MKGSLTRDVNALCDLRVIWRWQLNQLLIKKDTIKLLYDMCIALAIPISYMCQFSGLALKIVLKM